MARFPLHPESGRWGRPHHRFRLGERCRNARHGGVPIHTQVRGPVLMITIDTAPGPSTAPQPVLRRFLPLNQSLERAAPTCVWPPPASAAIVASIPEDE